MMYMTREEAYNRIDVIIAKHEIGDEYVTITNLKDYEALRTAKKFLKQEPCEDCRFKNERQKIGKLISVVLEKQAGQEPKTVTWNIKEVADALERHGFGKLELEQEPKTEPCEDAIEDLPPVTQKSGKWIEHEIEDTCRWLTCSVCGYEWINKKENF